MITLGFRQISANPRMRRPQPQINLFLKMCEQVLEFMQEQVGQGFEAFFARDGGSIARLIHTRDTPA